MSSGGLADKHPANVPFAPDRNWVGILHRDLGLCAWQTETALEADLIFWSAAAVWGYSGLEYAATIVSNRAAGLAKAAKWHDTADLQPVRHVSHQARVWLTDAVSDLQDYHDRIYSRMVQTAEQGLNRNVLNASRAVADIARNAKPRVPTIYVSEVLREAAKRHRIRYSVARKHASAARCSNG